MTVAVITPAESSDLVSLQSVKDYLNITDDNQEMSLKGLISRASSNFTRFLGRPLALQVYRERQHIRGRVPGVNLSRGPIAAIQSITVDGKPWISPLDECDVDREHARILSTAFLPSSHLRGVWCCVVEIVYTAGYLLTEQSVPVDCGTLLSVSAQNLPAAVAGGCLTTIQMLNAASARDPLLKSESIQGVGSASWGVLDAAAGSLSPDASAALGGLVLAADWMA